MWGSAAEAILLSIALAARMRVMKEEKERAQLEQLQTQQALNISQAETVAAQQESLNNKQIALDTIQKYSIKLEAEVKARTTELIDTQQKLIASEKMAALGVFTAGMAHEINNPANFVSAGAQNTEHEVKKLQTFLDELLDENADGEIKTEFDNRFTRINDSISVIKTGVQRIEKVVKQLRTDHPEGDVGMQPRDVVMTLESAWQVFSPTLKTPISLTQYLEYRPTVECAVSEIQQVFIALLSNAAHAIEDIKTERGDSYEGKITLKSEQTNDHLLITISDNGAGIPAENIEKIFDPFFTTKAVGRGAGLGLSMARDVLKKHHGTLEVKSTMGEGSTFMLRLPLSQPA
jgi:signal transduction histidine kinase